MAFSSLLYHIKHNKSVVSTFSNYQGVDWLKHVQVTHSIPTTTLFSDSCYKLDLHHWIYSYKNPYMSSYTGSNEEHLKILIGHSKLITLLPESSLYNIKPLSIHSYSYLPSDTEWLVSPTSTMLYYLRLTAYKN